MNLGRRTNGWAANLKVRELLGQQPSYSVYLWSSHLGLLLAAAQLEATSLATAASKVVGRFYPDQPHPSSQLPELLSAVPEKAKEQSKKEAIKASSLTLGILKSLYPRADLDVAKEGFAKGCTSARAMELVKDSIEAATSIVEMLDP
jgi:hypothetical protein